MKVTVEDAGGCRRLMRVEVGADDVLPSYSEVVGLYARSATVPGFRRGRAPAGIVEKRYAKDIAEDAKDRLLPKAYRDAVKKEGLRAASVVDVQDVVFARDKGLSFSVTLDLQPEIKLPKYKKITVTDQGKPVTDADVEEALNSLRERAARFGEVTGRGVRKGDLAQIDYSGVCDGEPVEKAASDCSGLGRATDFWALVGEPEFIPGIPAGMEGMQVGETRKIEVTFPGDHHVEAMRGKTAVYEVTVKAVRERILPELNEEFLKLAGAESVEKLRETIRKDLEERAVQDELARRRDEVAKFLLDGVTCDLPESVVAREAHATARMLVRRFAYQGATREQIEQRRDEIMGVAHRTSSDRVKLGYILSRIADEEKIEASDAELDERIARMASSRRETPEKVREDLEEDGAIEQVREDIRADKALEMLMSIAKTK